MSDAPSDVSPTLSLADASRRLWDAAVVGAGPAGALAAHELARRGLSVLLVEKARFPRAKVCGGCLNGAALAALHAAGLGELPERLGAPRVRAVKFVADRRDAVLSLPRGAAVSRFAFDAALARAAIAAGAAFLPQTIATLEPLAHSASSDERATRTLKLQQPTGDVRVRARAVIAADGLAGRLTGDEAGFERTCAADSYLGGGVMLDDRDLPLPPETIVMHWGRGGYVGLVRVEDGRIDVAGAFSPELVRSAGGLGPAAAIVLAEAGSPAQDAVEAAPWRGTPTLTRRLGRTAGNRLFVLGDAAGYVEPFTGEGMAWALSSAAWLAPAAAAWIATDAELATRGRDAERAREATREEFERRWRAGLSRFAAKRTWTCRAVKQLLRRPTLVGWAIRGMRVAPWLARWAVAAVNAPARSQDFAIPAFPHPGVP